MASFDESVINFTRHKSLDVHRSNPEYKFREISTQVETLPNNGMIGGFIGDYLPDDAYMNKCFFIALSQGLNKLESIKKFEIIFEPVDLMKMCGFTDQFAMVDTDINHHKQCLQTLANEFLETFQIQVHVYIGVKKDEQWFVSSDHFDRLGQGPDIIRILNKGKEFHFELITTDPQLFPRDIKTMTLEKAFEHQDEIIKQLDAKKKQEQQDYVFALWLEKNDH